MMIVPIIDLDHILIGTHTLGPHTMPTGPHPKKMNPVQSLWDNYIVRGMSENKTKCFTSMGMGGTSLTEHISRQLTSLSSTAGEWKAALWKLVSLRASQNGPGKEYALLYHIMIRYMVSVQCDNFCQ